MSVSFQVYRRWMRDRRRSTIIWSVSIAAVSVVTAAFFPSLGQSLGENAGAGSTTSSMLGLGTGIDPQTPVGFMWAANYSNQLPFLMMALAIALGTAAIAGDEADGTLEYLLSKPVTRSAVAMARAAGMITILVISAIVNLVAVAITAPLFELTDETTITAIDGTTSTAAALTFGELFVGGLSALAVALGSGAVAYFIGAATGRKGAALGGASAYAVAGYVLYTLSNVTGELEFLTWISPWRWFMDDAMMVNGLTIDILWPVALTVIAVVGGWQIFLRRDLRS